MSFILLGFIPSSSFIPISFYSSDFTHRIYTRHRPPSSLHKFHHALVHFTCSQDHITDRNDTSKQSISNTKNSNRFSASPSRRRFLQHAALLLTATVTTLTPILCDSSSSTSRNTAHAVSFNFPPEFVDGRTESQLLHDFKQLASTGLVTKSDDEWLAELGENSYYVLRQSATERPFTSNLLKEDREGTFCCKGCKTTPLFASIAKYNSGELDDNDDDVNLHVDRNTVGWITPILLNSLVIGWVISQFSKKFPGELKNSGGKVLYGETAPEYNNMSDEEWQRRLHGDQMSFTVLRKAGTEQPFSSSLLNEQRQGVFLCKGCGTPMFSSVDKFDSGTGWPSFKDRLEGVQVLPGTTADIINLRREVVCFTCKGHLGHVFCDGPAPTGYRYCINGVSLVFEPKSN